MSNAVTAKVVQSKENPLAVRVVFTGPRNLRGETTTVFIGLDLITDDLVRKVVWTYADCNGPQGSHCDLRRVEEVRKRATIMSKTLTLLFSLLILTGCERNLKEPAEAAARKWANAMGFEDNKIVCVNSDSDQDGYVSCTMVSPDKKVTAIECVGSSYTFNEGCRIPKLQMPGLGQ